MPRDLMEERRKALPTLRVDHSTSVNLKPPSSGRAETI